MSSGTGALAVDRRKPKSADQLRHELVAELEPYRAILEPFVRGEITADEIEARCFPMYAEDPRMCSDEVFDIVDRFFTDVDAYVSVPVLRDSPEDLGPDEVRELARDNCSRGWTSTWTGRTGKSWFRLRDELVVLSRKLRPSHPSSGCEGELP